MSKALLIKSQVDKNGGEVGKWNNLNNATSYIQGIHTGRMLEDISAEKLGSLISGIPTPWARAKLFKFAFAAVATQDPNINAEGLMQFYNMLHSEWRGLMAVIALYPDRIRFSEPVKMDVRGDDYEIASAFGRMLFNDKDVWSNQDELSKNPDAQPFIQLIYYRDHLVGGTSPLTGCFTGVDYSNLGNDASDIGWYRQGKFEEPMNYLTAEELQKLYLFVRNMNKNQQSFEQKINSQRGNNPRIDITGFKAISRQWEAELKRKGHDKLREVGPVAQYGNLSVPFADLFRSDVPVYMKPDFTFTYTNDGDYKVIGDIQGLLSKDNYVVGWYEEATEITKLSSSPVYYLRVSDLTDNSNSYFSLPLSEQGIDIFKNSLSTLLGYSSVVDGNTRLTAKINDAGQLAVTLVVEIDGEAVTLNKREYQIRWMTSNGRVILWPNFVSENWNKYYLYSEFTSDANENFIPFFKSEGQILRNIRGEFLTCDYELAPEEEILVDSKKLVSYPHGQGSDLLKYDILRTNKPMAGLMVKVKETGKPCNAGILMFRQDLIKDLTNINAQSAATVGIDFGSNNTCVYYHAGNHGSKPVQFVNNRAVIIGKENANTKAVAENNELLFFSNYETQNGQLKSWLHEHDSRYIAENTKEEIAGGVPVNRPNVLVNRMDEFIIETQAGNLHYNMKWLNDDKGIQKKRAFITSIWIQTCAFLVQNKMYPSVINWSYPGSMMEADVEELEKTFEVLINTMPISDKKVKLGVRTTEAEAVCSYALSNDNFSLNNNNMFLGIDVGGSTSDILLLAKNPQKGNQASLFRESSVRLAAGVFFNTVINSEAFRRALLNFHESKCTKVHVANIQEIVKEQKKAPYYLNSIFDQLKTEDDYYKFYNSIADNAKVVFTVPAYVTGLLLYYSGMLIGKTIKENNLDNITRIDVLSFGKGGRLFHWLRNAASNSTTMTYYKTCLNAGVKRVIDRELEVRYRDEIEVDNKAEVAKGLCDMQELNKMFPDNQSDICGEIGIRFTNSHGASRELCPIDELTGEYFDNDMNYFDFAGMECFEEFFNIFINFVSVKTKLCMADNELRNDLADLPNKVSGYICQDSEYKSAKRKVNNGGTFAYHQPLLIAEGACFLEKSLIKKVFN